MIDLDVASLLASDRNVCRQFVGRDDGGRIDLGMHQWPEVSCSVREDRTEPEETATRNGGERHRLVGATPGFALAGPSVLAGFSALGSSNTGIGAGGSGLFEARGLLPM